MNQEHKNADRNDQNALEEPLPHLGVKAVARILAVSPSLTRILIRSGDLPGIRVGRGKGRLVVSLDAVRSYLQTHKVVAEGTARLRPKGGRSRATKKDRADDQPPACHHPRLI